MPSPDRLFEDPNEDQPTRETTSAVSASSAEERPEPERVVVYTDGACSGNPGPGGWAWVVPDGPFAAGFDERTTNQRMELTATLEAVRAFDGPLLIVSDSTYVVYCFRDGWWEKWLRKGWVNSKREPVANREIWEPL
ncbi:MAG: ribonuclease H, partial [Actinomycetota bacterium]|nr:ribonuclease H [Actinomycetota bacterium]